MGLAATKIKTLTPNLRGGGFMEERWEVGKKKLNPDGKPDWVEDILLKEDNTVEITYRSFGKEVLFNHIDRVEFRSSAYSESSKKSGPVSDKDIKRGLNQGYKF